MIAPESFELDDVDGHAHAADEDIPESRRAVVSEAVNSCPEQAISVMIGGVIAGRAAHDRRLEH